MVKQLSLDEAKQWHEWDMLFGREEATYVLWPLGKQRNIQKVKVADARGAQNMTVVKKAVFEDREFSLMLCGKILSLLVPCNGQYATYLQTNICPICYVKSNKISSHAPNHERGGLWDEMEKNMPSGSRTWKEVLNRVLAT